MPEIVKLKLAPVLNRRGVIVGLTSAVMLAPVASAQATSGDVASINFSAWITALQTNAIGIINSAGPALFGLMAIIGGVYFVWNRVRSLW